MTSLIHSNPTILQIAERMPSGQQMFKLFCSRRPFIFAFAHFVVDCSLIVLYSIAMIKNQTLKYVLAQTLLREPGITKHSTVVRLFLITFRSDVTELGICGMIAAHINRLRSLHSDFTKLQHKPDNNGADYNNGAACRSICKGYRKDVKALGRALTVARNLDSMFIE
jgi:hypothetical protein